MTEQACPPTADTIAGVLAWAAGRLEGAHIEGVRLESRLLVARALNLSPESVFSHPERSVDDDARRAVSQLVNRRAKREPMAHITGEREFWSLSFAVSPDTLIPRPDSETLIEAVLDAFPDVSSTLRLLDLGTGSGCLLLSLLHERKNWAGVGLDRSTAALKVASANAATLGLTDRSTFVQADWNERAIAGLGLGDFDLVIANPPYIPEGDRQTLQPEIVDHEPSGALFAGEQGLDAYRTVVPQVPEILAPGAKLFLEIGIGQGPSVSEILSRHGFTGLGERQDLSGISRCLFAGIEKP